MHTEVSLASVVSDLEEEDVVLVECPDEEEVVALGRSDKCRTGRTGALGSPDRSFDTAVCGAQGGLVRECLGQEENQAWCLLYDPGLDFLDSAHQSRIMPVSACICTLCAEKEVNARVGTTTSSSSASDDGQ